MEARCGTVVVLDHTAPSPASAQNRSSVLARNRTWSTTFAKSRAIQHTPRTCTQYPAEDSNLVQRFRRPSCLPLTRRVQHVGPPKVGPNSLDSSSVFRRSGSCRSRARTGPSGLMKASGVPTTCSDLRETRTPTAMTAQRSERCVSANSTTRSLFRGTEHCAICGSPQDLATAVASPRIPHSKFHTSASPMGFEPTTSAVTGQRALRTAPRGQTTSWHTASPSARPMPDSLHAGVRRRAGGQEPTCQPE